MSLKNSLLTSAAISVLGTGLAMADPALIYDLGGKFDKSFNEAAYMGAQRWIE
ncbi:MAG: BMP family ABC transporter substrate-binding protein, partial [Paracoccus sp. (in: a-proteobacteria)]|nr:BMP family ABC transporter substrate-binding protein [Paracoccus sp. (in: a-proteobacteria)]